MVLIHTVHAVLIQAAACVVIVTLCCFLIDPGKQLVQYTPVLNESISLEGGGADLPSLLELEEEPFFSSDLPTDDAAADLLSHAGL